MLRKEELRYSSLYVATSNKGKLREFKSLGEKYGIQIERATVDKVELQSDSLEEIASYAALYVYLHLHKPVFVEDAGLFIEVLKGFPGPYSSYVYKTIGIKGILKLLEGVENRRACFKSAIALVIAKEGIKIFKGEVCGKISKRPRGLRGFGFDPIFIPEGEESTFGELELGVKNKISHRAMAFRKMAKWLGNNF